MRPFIRTVLFIVAFSASPGAIHPADQIPTSAPVSTDSAGKAGGTAAASVVRVICFKERTGGTGFVHKSGYIITAAHVVSDCERSEIAVVGMGIGGKVKITDIIADHVLDLAILKTEQKITVPTTLSINPNSNLTLGAQVTTWGYPGGYGGALPLLSVGYLAGQDTVKSANKSVRRWVVNAAFNGGNSGGPLLRVEDGTVIGVVSSKLAPLPEHIESALEALKNQKAGFMYTKTYADGKTEKASEGQVIHEVLQHLRQQTQLVIGHAVLLEDLRNFLVQNNIEP